MAVKREWLSVGRAFNENAATKDQQHRTADDFQQQVADQIATLTWQDVPDTGTIHGPMSPVLAIDAVIKEFQLRPVVAFAHGGCLTYPDGPETAIYDLVAVEVHSSKQHFRLHLLDTGVGCTPMCLDWYENTPANTQEVVTP